MKISLKWLQDFVDVSDFLTQPQVLADRLTQVGLEVESIHDLSRDLNQVVIGKIVELEKHPQSERLTVCKVDVAQGPLRQIVCGATNHRSGDFVVVALPGAVLPQNFAIKESKIREVESQGMLCSESELGLKETSEGILILPPQVTLGQSFATYAALDDVVFEINVTPNRADCLSHFGLAREVGCLLGRPVQKLSPKLKLSNRQIKDKLSLQVKAPKSCPRYAGRGVFGIKVGPSPQWLKQRLAAMDINSINNVVDVTNYVMMELGQPLHAFDLNFLSQGKIVVEAATANEEFISLDGSSLNLSETDLTIRDGHRAIALAGVVGGKNSGVQENTVQLFIESAHFVAEGVRRTARRLGVQTDSSYRFSRGTDPELVTLALNRACELIQQLAGGDISSDFYDEYPNKLPQSTINIYLSYVSERLGYRVLSEEFESWMNRLGCEVTVCERINDSNSTSSSLAKDVHYKICPPVYRWDLQHKSDLVEEFGRLKGYHEIPEHFPALQQMPTPHTTDFILENLLAEAVTAAGYRQAINYGFTSDSFQREILGEVQDFSSSGLTVSPSAVTLQNPMSEDLNVMRVSLLPGLVKNLLHNCRHNNEFGRLFEIGSVFKKSEDSSYTQNLRLGLIAWGHLTGLWTQNNKTYPLVFDLKEALSIVLNKLNLRNVLWQTPKVVPQLFHPTQTAALFCEGRQIGLVGSLHPEKAEQYKIRPGVALSEIDFASLMRGQPRLVKIQSHGKFPSVERDMTLLVPVELAMGEVLKELKKTAGTLLQRMDVVDLFTGEGVPSGFRAITCKYFLQDNQATLDETKILSIHNSLIQTLQTKFKIQLK
ncbi:MAG: phenylalanine--tRNA ligase subunit beta [Bdellovibrionales bacterium]|nr:phenylalanine--tRNA ligase subunit beta [Bdellovibrionales bacterium]